MLRRLIAFLCLAWLAAAPALAADKPVTVFAASLRGRPVPGVQPLDPAHIRQLGLMISDKQAGPFELLVDWIDVAC